MGGKLLLDRTGRVELFYRFETMSNFVGGFDFRWMIAPITTQFFASSYWAQRPLKINRQAPGYYSELLPEGDFEFILSIAVRFPGSVEELGADDNPRPCRNSAAALEACRKGKSLRIDSIQRFSKQLNLMCSSLEQYLSCPVNTNLYFTPEGMRALPRHYDTHDVFVLQTHGRKKWRIYDSPVELPIEYVPPLRCESAKKARHHRLDKSKNLAAKDTCKVMDEFVLESGDFLYLPRGYWHEAEAEQGFFSCHLTIGAQVFTYVDLLTIAIAEAAAYDPNLRRSLPLGFSTHADAKKTVKDLVSQILMTLPTHINAEVALAGVAQAFSRNRQTGQSRRLLHSGVSSQASDIGLASSICIRGGQLCYVYREGEQVFATFGAQKLSLPMAFEESCRFIAREQRFTPQELPGDLQDNERVALVELLIQSGLLMKCQADSREIPGPIDEFRGWLPTKLTRSQKAWIVKWRQFGQVALSEPFFAQSISRLGRSHPQRIPKLTGPEVLLSIDQEIAPSGFIFHMSRCGSTLISNALRMVPGTIVISEAQPIGELLVSRRRRVGSAESSDANRDQILRAIIKVYGQRRRGDETNLVIKFTSLNILSIELLCRLWPDVPRLIIIRNPLEVMVSCLDRPPGWMRLKKDPATASHILGCPAGSITSMPDEEFCARGIGAFLRAAVDNGNRCRIVNYEAINLATIFNIAEYFHLKSALIDREKVEECLLTYSKDTKGLPFVDDRASKQFKATELIRKNCQRWAQEPYALLKSKELA